MCFPLDEEGEGGEIVYDKRSENKGRPEKNFQEFYNELNSLLEEFGKAAEDRRKSQATHLPLAVSVPQLIKKVSSAI